MTISHEQDKHLFTARDDAGERMGILEYAPRDEKTVVATHTIVEHAYRGRGVAGELLAALTAWAEENAVRIVPQCEYVAAAFMREPKRYEKVIAE